jgi:putative transposase
MKRSRYTEEQIALALKHVELGKSVSKVCCKMSVSDATFVIVARSMLAFRLQS